MDYKIEKQPKLLFIGISCRTTMEEGRFFKDVKPLWETWHKNNLFDKIPNCLDENTYVIYTDYESNYTKPFTYMIARLVSMSDQIPEKMHALMVPAQEYAMIERRGEFPQTLTKLWEEVWKSDLKRAYAYDFEVYTPDFNPSKATQLKLYISIDKS